MCPWGITAIVGAFSWTIDCGQSVGLACNMCIRSASSAVKVGALGLNVRKMARLVSCSSVRTPVRVTSARGLTIDRSVGCFVVHGVLLFQ